MATTTFEKPMGSEVETLKSQIGTLSSLTTSAKSSTVAAINELDSNIANLITRKKYTVTVSPNQYVVPFTYLATINLLSDVQQYGNIVSIMAYQGGASYPACIAPTENYVINVMSGQSGDVTVYVYFSKYMNVVS